LYSSVTRIDVLGGAFKLNSSYSGIGFGSSTMVENLTIANGFFDCTLVTAGDCFRANTVTIEKGSTSVITGRTKAVNHTGWNIREGANLYFEYLSTSEREDKLVGHTMIHLGSILLPVASVHALTIRRLDGTDNDDNEEREFVFDGNRAQGCAFSVGSVGNYGIGFSSNSGAVVGRLHHDSNTSFDASIEGDNFFSTVDYVRPTTTPRATKTPGLTRTGQFTAGVDYRRSPRCFLWTVGLFTFPDEGWFLRS
jgi:hypothetical protein